MCSSKFFGSLILSNFLQNDDGRRSVQDHRKETEPDEDNQESDVDDSIQSEEIEEEQSENDSDEEGDFDKLSHYPDKHPVSIDSFSGDPEAGGSGK